MTHISTHESYSQHQTPSHQKHPFDITNATHGASPIVMASSAADESQPSIPLPPLLALPVEIKLKILSYFSDDSSSRHSIDPTNALTLMILRRTHKSFRRLITNPWKERQPTSEHIFTAECHHPYLFPSSSWSSVKVLYCYSCGSFLGRHVFRNWEFAYDLFQDDENSSNEDGREHDEESWDDHGGKHARKRHCDWCWDHSVYPDRYGY